jgi:hypothetical protein
MKGLHRDISGHNTGMLLRERIHPITTGDGGPSCPDRQLLWITGSRFSLKREVVRKF